MFTGALRESLRGEGLNPQWYFRGKRCSMTTSEMRDQHERILRMKAGTAKNGFGPGVAPPQLSRVGHAYWSRFVEGGFSDNVAIPHECVVGLMSAVELGRMQVTLWTYATEVENVPPGVVVRDACTLLSRARASHARSNGFTEQIVADWVRMLAVQMFPGRSTGNGETRSGGLL